MQNNRPIYRSKSEIYSDILTTISSMHRCRKKDILYKCNLSYNYANRYLDLLQENELIEYIPANPDTGDKDYYRMIEGGHKYLEMFKVIHNLITVKQK